MEIGGLRPSELQDLLESHDAGATPQDSRESPRAAWPSGVSPCRTTTASWPGSVSPCRVVAAACADGVTLCRVLPA